MKIRVQLCVVLLILASVMGCASRRVLYQDCDCSPDPCCYGGGSYIHGGNYMPAGGYVHGGNYMPAGGYMHSGGYMPMPVGNYMPGGYMPAGGYTPGCCQ